MSYQITLNCRIELYIPYIHQPRFHVLVYNNAYKRGTDSTYDLVAVVNYQLDSPSYSSNIS
jgi:hypothetical protein